MCMECEPLLKAINAYLRKVDDDEGDDSDPINEIEDSVTDALLRETRYFIREIRKKKTISEVLDILEDIRERDVYLNQIRVVVAEQLHKIVPPLVQQYVHVVDTEIKITALSKRTYNWIDNWSADLAALMKETSIKQLEDILKRGLDVGSDISSVTVELMQSGIRNEYYRARRVAVTEILRAHNVAKQEADMQNPCVKEKMWRHTGAHKNEPRPNHIDMDGQRVPVDQPYTLIGADGVTYHPMFPTDPELPPGESINCHCISQSIVDEDILAMPLEERQRLQQEIIDSMDDDWEKELDERNRAKAGIEA